MRRFFGKKPQHPDQQPPPQKLNNPSIQEHKKLILTKETHTDFLQFIKNLELISSDYKETPKTYNDKTEFQLYMIKHYAITNCVLSINEIIKQIKKYCEFDYKPSNYNEPSNDNKSSNDNQSSKYNNTKKWYKEIDEKIALATRISETYFYIPNDLNKPIQDELSRYIADIKLHCNNLKWISNYIKLVSIVINKCIVYINKVEAQFEQPISHSGGKKTIRKRISKRSSNKKILN